MPWLQAFEFCRVIVMGGWPGISQCPIGGADWITGTEVPFIEAPVNLGKEDYVTAQTAATTGWCLGSKPCVWYVAPKPRVRPKVFRCHHRCGHRGQ